MNLRSLFLAIISATSANIFAEHTNATSVKNSKPQETCFLSSLRVPLTDKEVEERHAHEKLLEAAGKRVVITENPGQRPKFRTEYQACNCNPQLYAQTVKAHPAVASQYYGNETALHIAAKTCSAQDVEKIIAAHIENGISPAPPTQISFGDLHNPYMTTYPDKYLFHLFTQRSDWQSSEDMAAVQRMIRVLSKYIDINQTNYGGNTALSNVVLWDGWFNDKGITVEDQKKWAQLLIDNGATARWWFGNDPLTLAQEKLEKKQEAANAQVEVPEAHHIKYKKEDAIDHAAMQRYMDAIYGKFQRYAQAKQIAQDWSKFVHFLEHYKPGKQLPEYKEQAELSAQERSKHDAALVEHAQTTIAQLQDPAAAQKLFDQTCKLKPADYSTEDAYINALLARFKTCMNLRQKQKELRNKTA